MRPELRVAHRRCARPSSPRRSNARCARCRSPSRRRRGAACRSKAAACAPSNIPPWEGREWFHYPMAPGQLGHEGVGHRSTRSAEMCTRSRVGDRVALLSEQAYAEYDVARRTIRSCSLPDALADQPFPAEPLGCAMNIFRRSDITRRATPSRSSASDSSARSSPVWRPKPGRA